MLAILVGFTLVAFVQFCHTCPSSFLVLGLVPLFCLFPQWPNSILFHGQIKGTCFDEWHTCLVFLTCIFVIQKPGGIIALLDEAWYVLRDKTTILFFNLSFIYIYIYFFFVVCDVALFFLCSMFPRSTHETFAEKLYQTFKDHKRFSKPKLSRSSFTICHYAGDVSIWNSFRLAQ